MLNQYEVISIVGNAKNAGKTTVLNSIIETFHDRLLAITSIGLDGELIDNVTSLPKPRIFVYENMIVATALECLKAAEATYEIIDKTGIETALGEIVLIRIIHSGNVLVGGPSIVTQMESLVAYIKTLNVDKILIDGAFSRKTISKSTDACIFAIGAVYSSDLSKVIDAAKLTIAQFSLNRVNDSFNYLETEERVVLIYKDGTYKKLEYDSVIQYQQEILEFLTSDVEYIYIPGSLPTQFAKELIRKRRTVLPKIILKSPTHMVLPEILLNNLFNSGIKIIVLHPVNLVGIMYNPFSPTGYVFDDREFQDKLKKITHLPVINVMNERRNDIDG